MKLKNIRYMKKVKGSVLLTVICVMFVMLIIVTATLTLAANASNRAYADYQKNQATYTARSVVNKTIETLQIDAMGSAVMANEIFNYMDANGGQVELQVNSDENGVLAGGYGTVDRVVLERVGVDNQAGYYISGTEEDIVKITAHVTMGNKTVTYSQYVNNAKLDDNPPSGSSGFIALGGNAGFTSTNIKVFGPAGANVSAPSTQIEKLLNEGTVYDEKFYNSPLYINTRTNFILPQKKGVSIWGGVCLENDSVTVDSTYDSMDNLDVKNTPYFYVDGTLGFKSRVRIGSIDKPVNVFAGRILTTENSALNLTSNVYLYNQSIGAIDFANLPNLNLISENNFSEYTKQAAVSVFKANDGSNLLNWYTNGALANSVGGDFYTLGDVVIENQNQPFYVAGDMYVKGNLHLEKGKLKVKGTLKVDGNVSFGAGVDPLVNIVGEDGTTPKKWDGTEGDLSFPNEMQKDEITKMTAEDSDSDGVSDKYVPGANKFIKTKEDMFNSYYENPCNPTALKGDITKDSFPVVSDINMNKYTNVNIPKTIDSNCAIIGEIYNDTYTFKQPSDSSIKSIDVVLVNVKTHAGTKFIIDETDYAPNSTDANGKVISKFRVNFYIANNDLDGYQAEFGTINNAVEFNKTNIITVYYNNKLLTGPTNVEIDGLPDDIEPIPYVNLFALGEAKIDFNDTCIFTGSIFAPRSIFTFKNSLQINKNITYKRGSEETVVSNPKIALIGSAIVGQVEEMQNDPTVFVVSSDGIKKDYDQDPNFSWTPINGFSNY